MTKLVKTSSSSSSEFDVHAETKRLQTLVTDILSQTKQLGATQAEVGASSDNGFTVNVRLGEVETVEFQSDKSIGITVYFGKRKGSASTSDTSAAAVQQAIAAACDIAKFTSEDECNGLADKDLMAYNYPDLDLYHPWSITTTEAIALAQTCEAKGMAFDKKIKNSEGASVSTHAGVNVYGNSHGFLGVVPATRHDITCVLVAEDNSGMQRDYDYSLTRDPLNLTSVEKIAESAAKKTVARLQARSLSMRKTPVIYAADVAKSLIGALLSALSGGNLYRQTSFLLNSLGKSVMPEWITLIEKPHMKKTLGSSPFDSEGVLTRECALIDQGVVQHYILGSYSARKLGLKTTGNAGGVNNLIVNHSNISFNELLKQMDTGFLVTELIGQGINITTGDYSRGAAGFWIEQGKIVHPVEEVTIAGNLKDMLQGIAAISNDVETRGNICTGSILINEMMLAGRE